MYWVLRFYREWFVSVMRSFSYIISRWVYFTSRLNYYLKREMFAAWTFFIIIICVIIWIRYRVLKIYTMGRIIKFHVLLWTATEGWDAWSSWSLCDADGMQVRRRRCTIGDLDHVPAPGLCQGRSQEERVCISNFEGIVIQTCMIFIIYEDCVLP